MDISRVSTSAMIDGTAFHNLCHMSCNIPHVLQADTQLPAQSTEVFSTRDYYLEIRGGPCASNQS